MLGREAMLFQGYPISKVPDTQMMKTRLLHGLAGIAVSLPVALALLLSACKALTWKAVGARERGKESTTEDINHALELLKQLGQCGEC